MYSLIKKIENALRGELPGISAHKKFAPPGRINSLYLKDANHNAAISSVLLLLFPMNGECCISFIKRPHTLRNHAGQISFPGGKYEDSNHDLYFTAKRETAEEIGVNPDLISYLGKLSELYVPVSQFCIHPFVGWSKSTPAFQISHDEVDCLLIFPLKEFNQPENKMEVERETSSGRIKVPAFFINNEVIWGATAMILSELLEIIDPEWFNHKMTMPPQTQFSVDKSDNEAH